MLTLLLQTNCERYRDTSAAFAPKNKALSHESTHPHNLIEFIGYQLLLCFALGTEQIGRETQYLRHITAH